MEDFGFDLRFEATRVKSDEPIYAHALKQLSLLPSMATHLEKMGWGVWAGQHKIGEQREFHMRFNGEFDRRAYRDNGDTAWHGPGRMHIVKDQHSYHCDGHECEEPHHHIDYDPLVGPGRARAEILADTLAPYFMPIVGERQGETVIPRGHIVIDPKGVDPRDKDRAGSKLDVGKAPIWQGCLNYFPRALTAIAMVSEYGHRKYGEWGGWRRVADGDARYTDAKSRHMLLPAMVGDYDEGDSGLAHLAQEAWNALAKLERALEEKRLKIMRGNDIVDGKPVIGTAKEYVA